MIRQTIDERADGQDLALAVGDELDLALSENPTTGYRWAVGSNGAPACALASDDFAPPSRDHAGEGGRRMWRFRVVRQGRGTIALTYGRGGQTSASFTLHVTASPG